jgi:hypothetical protein
MAFVLLLPNYSPNTWFLQGLDQILRDFESARHLVLVGTQSTNEIVLRSLLACETTTTTTASLFSFGFMHVLDVDVHNRWTLQQRLHENYVDD